MKHVLKTICLLFIVQVSARIGFTQPTIPSLTPSIPKHNAGSSQDCKEAIEKTLGAKVLVLGDHYTPDFTSPVYLKALKNNGYATIATTAQACAAIKNFSFKEQADLFKAVLFDKESDAIRKPTIDDASREVFGYGGTTAEYAYWDAKIVKDKKDWYATMVSANTAKLTQDKNRYEIVIQEAYVTAFGRMPAAAEQQKWMGNTTHYRIIYQNLIAYMYSPDGAEELDKVVKSTFTRIKQQYTDEQVKQRMMKAKEQKMDFLKMVAYFG